MQASLNSVRAELEEKEGKRHKLKRAFRKLQKEKEQDRALRFGLDESWKEKFNEITMGYQRYDYAYKLNKDYF